jgi:hypothetical protein
MSIYKHFTPTWTEKDMAAVPLAAGITGIVPGRNVIRLDYCAHLAVGSLLPICNEVIFCDSDSDDGTREFFEDWAKREPKLRVINYPWPDPVGDHWMLPKWMNFAREHARFESQMSLDADEVLHPMSYPRMKLIAAQWKSSYFRRLNFWQDPRHLAPHNTVCAQNVVRQCPTKFETVCDGFYKPEPPAKMQALPPVDELKIFHMGFLRRNEAFFEKSKVVQRALLNTYDNNLKRAEDNGVPWYSYTPFKEPMLDYRGDYPPGVVEWLRERGYEV